MITHLARSAELADDEIEISGPAYRHLFRARRLGEGDRLRVVDGGGGARWGKVVGVDRRAARIALGGPAPANEPTYRLELVVAALRGERASWLVEKATEIGVWAVRFVTTERTPRQYPPAQLERLRRVAAAAVVQCHRSRLPEISGVDPWRRLPELLAPAADRWVLDLETSGDGDGDDGGWRRHGIPRSGGAGAVLVGPEGGWTDDERRRLEALGCVAVGLGARTQRAETAAVAAAARLLLG